ncbi:MAG: hypothetical protein II125_01225, partial [Ruminococcus sp.]|nr:hypothetical protein [Ruminococcus sp.]
LNVGAHPCVRPTYKAIASEGAHAGAPLRNDLLNIYIDIQYLYLLGNISPFYLAGDYWLSSQNIT